MAIGEISFEELDFLVRALAVEKEWSAIVDEVLLRKDTLPLDGDPNRDQLLKIATQRCIELDQKDVDAGFICSWMILVYRSKRINKLEFDDRTNLQVEDLLTEFLNMNEDLKICLMILINVLLEERVPNDVECKEEAHMILQILQSHLCTTEISFEKHIIGKERVSLFWNLIVKLMPRNKIEDHSQIWGDFASRRTKKVDQKDIENIVSTGDAISENIFKVAKFAQTGLANHIVPNVTKGIEKVGEIVIQNTTPSVLCTSKSSDESNMKSGENNDLKALVDITDSSVQKTDSIRQGARSIVFGIRDISTRSVQHATEAWKEKGLGKQLIPDEDVREVVIATGKVGIATLGAAALITESMFETTKAVAQTTVKVASDVANHKYGSDAGKLVSNAGVASGNVLRTITHVGMLEATVLTKAVARNTAKVEMQESEEHTLSDHHDVSKSLEKSVPGITSQPSEVLD